MQQIVYMKNFKFLLLFCALISLNACNNKAEKEQDDSLKVVVENTSPFKANATGEPWSQDQLLEPGDLAMIVEDPNERPVILSLGAGGIIPGSIDTGASGEPEALENLREELQTIPKDTEIVLYCGCCPFDICPNIRPAFSLLNKNEFKNHQLLNLRDNIKVDWIDLGYPVGKAD